MRVLHVIPSVSKVHGGPSHALVMMERSLTDMGMRVTTATTDDDGPGLRLSKALRPINVNGAERHYARKWGDFYTFAPGLVIWLLRHCRRFDVIHIHALFSFSSVAGAFAAWARGVPYVVRPLGTLNAYGVNKQRPFLKAVSFRLIESRILAHADAVHFTSQAEWDEAKMLGVPMRGVVVPLGIVGLEPSSAADAPFAVTAEQKVVFFLSRLHPKKNVEGLLRGFALVRRRHANTVLVIAGDGPADYVRSLRNTASVEGIGGATIWAGHIDGPRKWAALAAADIFVLPSFSENFGIAAGEALLAGLPCVIGRGVAIAGAIAEAGAGLVTEPDPASIAHNLDRLLRDPVLCREMGARGRWLANREYSSMAMAARLSELYTSISGSAANARQCLPKSVAIASIGESSGHPDASNEQ